MDTQRELDLDELALVQGGESQINRLEEYKGFKPGDRIHWHTNCIDKDGTILEIVRVHYVKFNDRFIVVAQMDGFGETTKIENLNEITVIG